MILTIRNGSRSTMLYFKLPPLAVFVLFAAATEAEALQSNSGSSLHCVAQRMCTLIAL